MLRLIKFFSLIRLSFSGRVAEEDPWWFFLTGISNQVGVIYCLTMCNSLLFPLYKGKHLGEFASWTTWLLIWLCKVAENVHLQKDSPAGCCCVGWPLNPPEVRRGARRNKGLFGQHCLCFIWPALVVSFDQHWLCFVHWGLQLLTHLIPVINSLMSL